MSKNSQIEYTRQLPPFLQKLTNEFGGRERNGATGPRPAGRPGYLDDKEDDDEYAPVVVELSGEATASAAADPPVRGPEGTGAERSSERARGDESAGVAAATRRAPALGAAARRKRPGKVQVIGADEDQEEGKEETPTRHQNSAPRRRRGEVPVDGSATDGGKKTLARPGRMAVEKPKKKRQVKLSFEEDS